MIPNSPQKLKSPLVRATYLYDTAQGRERYFIYLFHALHVALRTALISQFAQTDPIRAQTSKKDPRLREEDIRQTASGPLSAIPSGLGRLEEPIRGPRGSLLILGILLYAYAIGGE